MKAIEKALREYDVSVDKSDKFKYKTLQKKIIPRNNVEKILEIAIKDIFEKIEKWVESNGLTDLNKCKCTRCKAYRRLKKEELA